MKTGRAVPRRAVLQRLLSASGLAVLSDAAFAQVIKGPLPPTMPMELGPFYPVSHPNDVDADLTHIKGRKKRAEGDIVYVAGRVLNQAGDPVTGAKIEVWQANRHGRYAHASDDSSAPLDENFQGFAALRTDSQGQFRFKTIRPGSYAISDKERRTPHIHFDVTGKHNRISAQMLFPGEPLNEKDLLYRELRPRLQAESMPVALADTVIAKSVPVTKEMEQGAISLVWDIVLLNG